MIFELKVENSAGNDFGIHIIKYWYKCFQPLVILENDAHKSNLHTCTNFEFMIEFYPQLNHWDKCFWISFHFILFNTIINSVFFFRNDYGSSASFSSLTMSSILNVINLSFLFFIVKYDWLFFSFLYQIIDM